MESEWFGPTASRNIVKNNVSLNSEAPFTYSDTLLERNTVEGNLLLTEEDFIDPANGDYRLKKSSAAAETTDCLDEDFDLGTVGVQWDKMQKPDPTFEEEFRLTSPKNGTQGIDTDEIIFQWQKPMGGDRYRIVVARDSELKDVIHDVTTYNPYQVLGGFENDGVYYWKVYATNDAFNGKEFESSYGVPYMFTIAKRFRRDTTNLQAVIIEAKAKLAAMQEGDGIGQYIKGTKEVLQEKIESAERMLKYGGYSEEDQGAILTDIDDLMNNDNYINGGYVNLGDYIADVDKWDTSNSAATEIDGASKTLKLGYDEKNYAVCGYTGVEDYSRVLALSFKMKMNFDANPNGWAGMGLRGKTPVAHLFQAGNDQYYMVIKPGKLEYQKNSGGGGKILEVVEDPAIKNNEWLDIDFGVINLGNVGQLTILKVNGKVAYQAVDTEADQVMTKGTFQLCASPGVGVEVMASDKELGSFDELVAEYSLKMTKDLCVVLEAENMEKGSFIAAGSKKAYYGGALHDIAIPANGEGTKMRVTPELAANAFGGSLSDNTIIVGGKSYKLPEKDAYGMINLKELGDVIGMAVHFHSDNQLAYITKFIDMHYANLGNAFTNVSNALALYK